MFHLILTACMISDPQSCAQLLLPAGDAPSQQACQASGAAIAQDWAARHGGLRAKSTACVDTANLPALPLTEIARGVHLRPGAVAPPSQRNRGQTANLSVIIGDTVAVIDAGGSRKEGEALYAAIRRLTDKPISHVILTSAHPAHVMGAEVFSEAGASIIADADLPKAVADQAASWAVTLPQQIGTQNYMGSAVAPIDQVVAHEVVIRLGRRKLTLTPAPLAHSDSNLVVYDQSSRSLFTGDMVFRGLTPSVSGSIDGWLNWIEAGPPQTRARLIVPGHGPVSRSWQEATAPQRAYLLALRDAIENTLGLGLPLNRAIPVIVNAMRPVSEGWADFRAITARNASTIYSQMNRP